MGMPDIFLSYAAEDEPRASQLADVLEAAGVSVWRHTDTATAAENIERLRRARCVLVLWSAASVVSARVRAEAEEGRDRGVLVPVRLEDVALPCGFEMLQMTDLSDWRGEPLDPRISALLDGLRPLLEDRAGERPAPAELESVPKPAAEPEQVLLGASAPQTAGPGSEFTVRFVAYGESEEAAIAEVLTGLSPSATSHLGLKRCRWQPGTEVVVRLTARGLAVSPASQAFTWEGRRVLLDFDVAVPADAPLGVLGLKLDVFVDEIVVAMLRFDLELAADVRAGERQRARAPAARSAFASYSSHDQQRVLDRVAAVRISAGLDIFLDCMSLHPGEEWKPQLEREIKSRDLFLLFWSFAASQSPWVTWEWKTALRERGRSAMQIHPLEVGVTPPEELKDLHFGDAYMLARKGLRSPT